MAKAIVRQLILGFGFFNGVWFSLGINPQQEVINFLQPLLSGLSPLLKTLFIILPTLLTISTVITVFKIYHNGGIMGAGAVVLAFAAGALLLGNWQISVILLCIAAVLGNITLNK